MCIRDREWGDGSKHGPFDDVFGDNIRSIDIFNYRDCIGIRNPSRPVREMCIRDRQWEVNVYSKYAYDDQPGHPTSKPSER